MGWKAVHRWLGLTIGTLAVVLGITGAILAFDPVQEVWQAPAAPTDLSVAALVERVRRTVPGAEEIRHLPSGAVVVFSFDTDQAQASYVDPVDGRVLSAWKPSALPRWVKNLHRSLLLGDAGRWGAAGVALAIATLCISALVLLLRRMGGWSRLTARVRGSLAQRIHVITGRVVLAVLCLTSLTALTMSSSTLGLVALDAGTEPDVVSVVSVDTAAKGDTVAIADTVAAADTVAIADIIAASQADLPVGKLSLLQGLSMQDLRALNFPDAADPEDTWKVATNQGVGWIDRYSGQTLAWQDVTPAQRIYDWALMLHTGERAWPWALVLALVGASVPLFWLSGVVIWWQLRRQTPHITGNSPLAQADTLIFVASEGGSTWGFAQALHDALAHGGHRLHTSALEDFRTTTATRQVFVLAATYGDGQAPAHASGALERMEQLSASTVPVTVLGFGDRQYPSFCAFGESLEKSLRARGWPALLPLECINQQSSQQFTLWGHALAQALGEPLELNYVPRTPPTTALTLVARQDYPGWDGQPTAILRFEWPLLDWAERLRGHGLAHFSAGDLVGIVPPGSAVPRFYSLASGWEDRFLEICVRQTAGGMCSTHLMGLQPGDHIPGFIRSNPGFTLPRTRRPVLLIGAGTGVAPLAGFIRRNDRHTPMHLYFGSRDPARDFYFGPEIQRWLKEGRLARVRTVFSRMPDGGGYVQDALRRDAEFLRDLVAKGAIVRVCGGRTMAREVVQTLDTVLAPLQLSVPQLKAKERYAEDIF